MSACPVEVVDADLTVSLLCFAPAPATTSFVPRFGRCVFCGELPGWTAGAFALSSFSIQCLRTASRATWIAGLNVPPALASAPNLGPLDLFHPAA